jgi:hypothetical protein
MWASSLVDAMVVLLAAHKREWWAYYALMATIGEVAGGFLTYRLAQRGEEKTIEKKIGKKHAAQVYRWFAKSGFLAVFVGSMLPLRSIYSCLDGGRSHALSRNQIRALYGSRPSYPFLRYGLSGQNLWTSADQNAFQILSASAICGHCSRCPGGLDGPRLLRLVSGQASRQSPQVAGMRTRFPENGSDYISSLGESDFVDTSKLCASLELWRAVQLFRRSSSDGGIGHLGKGQHGKSRS